MTHSGRPNNTQGLRQNITKESWEDGRDVLPSSENRRWTPQSQFDRRGKTSFGRPLPNQFNHGDGYNCGGSGPHFEPGSRDRSPHSFSSRSGEPPFDRRGDRPFDRLSSGPPLDHRHEPHNRRHLPVNYDDGRHLLNRRGGEVGGSGANSVFDSRASNYDQEHVGRDGRTNYGLPRPINDVDQKITNDRNRHREADPRCESIREAAPPDIPFISQDDSNSKFTQCILLLVGMPGSGKSTFADSLVKGKPWMFVRINQDFLGTTEACEDMCRRVLSDGKCPIIDRCNSDPQQRKSFFDVAKAHNNGKGVPIDGVVLNTPMETCIRRCQSRPSHPSTAPSQAREVVERMVQKFSPPFPNRINAEKFRNLRAVIDASTFYDAVMEFLNLVAD